MPVDRELAEMNHEQMNLLREILQIKEDRCHYCEEKIDFKKDKFSIFNKPTRIICKSILCMSEAFTEDED